MIAALLPIVAAHAAAAQRGSQRPALKFGADTNSWQEYYDAGIASLLNEPRTAETMFQWSSRLRPDRPEPLFARWVAFWMRDIGRFEKYLDDDRKTLSSPAVIAADSLRVRALWRNPFVHQGLILFPYSQLSGSFRDEPITRAWDALGQSNLPRALEIFGGLVKRDPKRNGYLRFIRASAFVLTRRIDSAAAQITELLEQLRREDEKKLVTGYESKELLEYALGRIHLEADRAGPAREAFGRAVAENAAFAPAHAALGNMALVARDSGIALLEFGTALELDSSDVENVIGYGKALRLARRLRDAAVRFRKAIALEPDYAVSYFLLGTALDDLNDNSGALDAYTAFLSRAALAEPRRSDAQRRVAALRQP